MLVVSEPMCLIRRLVGHGIATGTLDRPPEHHTTEPHSGPRDGHRSAGEAPPPGLNVCLNSILSNP